MLIPCNDSPRPAEMKGISLAARPVLEQPAENDMPNQLNAGAPFPEIPLTLLDGRTLRFPAEAEGRYRLLFFYRGHW